jgi:hypothetical protein
MEAVAKTVAELVVTVNHQINENWTSWLPKIEKACPLQIEKKGKVQFPGLSRAASTFILAPQLIKRNIKII